MNEDEIIVLKPELVIEGTMKPPEKNVVVVIKDSKIIFVGSENEMELSSEKKYRYIDLPDKTILPGLIDSHIHLALGINSEISDPSFGLSYDIKKGGLPTKGASHYIEEMRASDGVMLASGIYNAKQALHAGITTVRDCGERNRVGFDLRDAWKLGLFPGPRIIAAGRALTITGGHFHFCNDCECDGPWEVRKRTRQMIMEGADFIKMMVGTGTTIFGGYSRTDNSLRAFTVEEVRAAVEEAERVGKYVYAHCESYDSVGAAAEAGVHIITHLGHLRPDGSRGFDEEAAKKIVDKGLYVDMNMRMVVDSRDALRAKKERGETLSENESAALAFWEFKVEHKKKVHERLHKMGAKILASSDGIGLGQCNQLVKSLEVMVESGMTPLEAIHAATGTAAEAEPSLRGMVGTLTKGKEADIIAVEGDPSKNISTLWSPVMVMQAGKIVPLEQNTGLKSYIPQRGR